MRAFVFLKDDKDRKLTETVLRRLGCDDIVNNPDDIGNGCFHYAVLQVFDETVDRLRYDMSADHPRMKQLAAFVRAHPECYVLAITHVPCTNDGNLAHVIGADYWLSDNFLALLESHLAHARTFHRMAKGIPDWDRREVAASATASEPAA